MTKNLFAHFIRHCDPQHIKETAIEENGKLIPIKKMIVSKDSKRIYFHAVNEKDNFNILKNQIEDCKMLITNHNDYQYSILITTKTDSYIKVHINMEEGYSPYAYTSEVVENYSTVAACIPKYMDKFKGKTVNIQHCTNTVKYRTFSEETDGVTMTVTDRYTIKDFDYEIFYDKFSNNIPCIRMYSNTDNSVLSCAMGVDLINGNMIFTADGYFKISITD